MTFMFNLAVIGRQSLSSIWMPLLVLGLPACHAQPSKSEANGTSANVDRPSVKAPMGTRIDLTLVGYNYTDRYIDRFDVDGQGGGNLFVSEGLNGGGKSACCVSYRSGANARKVTVRWQSGACTFTSYLDEAGRKHERTHSFFKEVEVQVDPSVPDFPNYFEVHFYPDGHAEAAITEHQSRSRLILNKDREDNSAFQRCPNDKEPKK